MAPKRVRRAVLLSSAALIISGGSAAGAWAQTAPAPPPQPAPTTDTVQVPLPPATTPDTAAPASAVQIPLPAPTTAEQPPTGGTGEIQIPTGQPPASPSGVPATDPTTGAPVATQTEGVVVERIVVEGAERIETGTVLSYLPIRRGQTVGDEQLDLAVETLYRTGLFSDVDVSLRGSDLVIRVAENPIINQVTFEGNDALSTERLREEVTIRPRGVFTRARVQQDVQRLVEVYRRSGRIGATVTPQIVELPQRRVDLVFVIDEGPRTGILRVNFIGNEEFSDGDLRDVVITEESRFYRFFSTNTNYDPDRLEADREQLREFYRNRGYYDFRVISAVAELTPQEDAFSITFTVDEGEQYRFGNLTVNTELRRLDPQFLRALIPIRQGTIYEDRQVESAVDTLTFAAGSAGFAFVDIRPEYTPNREARTIDVAFNVREGPRVYVERIDVVGNSRTLDRVIRRELLVAEGDAYNRVLVERSRTSLRALGFFRDVTIENSEGSAPDRTNIRVAVQEQPTGTLSFGIGFSSVDNFLVDLGVEERNFRGRGQNLRLRLSLGALRQTLDFSFTEPRFLGRDLAGGIDFFSYRYDYSDFAAFDTSQTGGRLRLGFRVSEYATMFTRYNLQSDTVSVDGASCELGLVSRSICDQAGSRITSLVGYTLFWDRRNDPVRPTRGFDFTGRQDFAGLGGDVNYVRTEVEGTAYYGFRPQWVLQVGGQAGYIQGWGGDQVRINDRFFKGGYSFRGFEVAGLGPRDLTFRDALGGNLYAIGTAELRFPTGLPEQYGISAAVFADVGTVGLLDEEQITSDAIRDDLSLRAAVGLSIFWTSPLGPIRFDFSQVLAREDYDKTETFRFSTNTQF